MVVKGNDTPDSGTDDLDSATLEDLFEMEMDIEGDEDGDDGATEGSDADDNTSDDEALDIEDAEEDGEQEEDADEDSEEDSEDEDLIEDDEADAPEDLDDKLVVTKVDGVESTVTVKEARHGYMRMQDYTRKTTEVANKNKEIESQKQAYGAAIAQLTEHLSVLTGADKKPDQSLRDSDPGEYAAQMADYNALVEYRNGLTAEQKRLQEEANETQRKALVEAQSVANEKLLELLPSWKETKTREREQRALVKFMQARGFEAEEIAGMIDPRAVILVREALLFNQQKSRAKEKIITKGSGKRKPAPSLAPKGNSRPKAGGKHNAQRAVNNVRFGSSVDDLAAALSFADDL